MIKVIYNIWRISGFGMPNPYAEIVRDKYNGYDSDAINSVPTKWRARYIVSLRGIGRMQFAFLAVGSGDPTAN
jgi:hypothetical protein